MSDQLLSAINSLAASVGSLQSQLGALISQVVGRADATAVSALSNTSAARAGHAEQQGQAIGVLATKVAEAAAATSLTSRVTCCEPADLLIDAGQAVEPLRMGKVVFHGETARQIRAAQTVLREAGAGQLEVVKRANEPGGPFVVIDGQVFIAKSAERSAVVNPGRFEIKLASNEQGHRYAVGFGLTAEPQLHLGSQLVDAIRNLLRDELQPGGMLHRS
jgi:fructose-specific component phosphotransferase system IIB-like protein